MGFSKALDECFATHSGQKHRRYFERIYGEGGIEKQIILTKYKENS